MIPTFRVHKIKNGSNLDENNSDYIFFCFYHNFILSKSVVKDIFFHKKALLNYIK